MDCRQNLFSFLRSCAPPYKCLKQARILHQKVITLGFQDDHHFCKSLIDLYMSLHLFDTAKMVLNSTQNTHHTTLWNSILAACAKNNLHKEALDIFRTLRFSPHVQPDSYTFPSVLKACSRFRNAVEGRRIHSHVLKSGIVSDVVVSSSLMGMYAKCSLFHSAIRIFDDIPMNKLDAPCWNTVISSYCQDGQASDALMFYRRMINCGFKPDSVTYATVLSACARLSGLEMGKKIHVDLMRSGLQLDGFVSAALVDMYCKCGSLKTARDVFEQIFIKCVVSWNSMIGGYALIGDSRSCLDLFSQMHIQGLRPTSTTISSVLIACSRSSHLYNGKFVHGYTLRNKIELDIFVYTALVDLYFKCGHVVCAESIFKEMSKDNVVSWNVMISGYVSSGAYFKAIDIFRRMRDIGVRPDVVSFASVLSACSQLTALEQGKEIHSYISNHKLESSEVIMGALLDMYAKCGAVEEARQVFDRLPVRDVVSWTSMIMAYGSHGQASAAVELFNNLKKSNEKPDHVTFLAVLSACAHGGLVDEGYSFFNQMVIDYGIEPQLEHYSCLVDLLGRAGKLGEAYRIIEGTPSTKADVGLLGSLLSACILHKNFQLGEKIAQVLMSLDPDDHSTYIALANMYASAGRWVDVRNVRLEMKQRGLMKNPGCSWIEIDKTLHQFFVKDGSHPLVAMIYDCLGNLVTHIAKEKNEGYNLEIT